MQTVREQFTEFLRKRGVTGDEVRLDLIYYFLKEHCGEKGKLPNLISVPTAAALIGVSRPQGYVMAKRGQFPIVKTTEKRIMVNTHEFLELYPEVK